MTENQTQTEDTKTDAPKRTKEEIAAEYNACCGRTGDLSYRIAVMKEDLQNHYKRMFELNQEARTIGAQPEVKPGLEAVK